MTKPAHFRPLRTFVRREGRLTSGQQEALNRWLEPMSYPDDQGELAPASVFERDGHTVLEIGFGNGENVAAMAAGHPDWNVIGLEVHRPGVGALLRAVDEQQLTNVRVSTRDAVEFMAGALPEASIDQVQIFFPDPWPKKRHHKRRIVSPRIMDTVARCLKPGGILLLATDWAEYAEQMLDVLNAHPAFANRAPDNGYSPRADRVLTRFEMRGRRLGHDVFDLAYTRR